MSSSSGSDGVNRNQNLEYNQRLRDQYEERETEETKRHQREVARLQKDHQKQMNEMQEGYQSTIDEINTSSRTTISKKDAAHMRDIEKMQDLSRKQTTNLQQKSDDRFQHVTESLREENDRQRLAQAKQDQAEKKKFVHSMKEKDQQQEEISTGQREGYLGDSQKTRKDYSDRLQIQEKEHAAERAKLVAKMDEEKTELRRNKDSEIRRLEELNRSQKNTMQRQKESELKQADSDYNFHMERTRNLMAEGIQENRDKYQLANKKHQDDYNGGFENFRSEVNDRVSTQVGRLENQVADLRSENTRGLIAAQEKNTKERKNYAKEFQANFEELEKRRTEGHKDLREKSAEEIRQVQNEHDKFIQKSNEFHDRKLEETRRQMMESTADQVGQTTRERDWAKAQMDLNRKKVADAYGQKLSSSNEFQTAQLETARQSFENTLHEDREQMTKGHRQEVQSVEQRALKQVNEDMMKHNETIQNYETKLNDMRQDYEKKLKRQDENYRNLISKQLRSAEMDREKEESRLQSRVNEIKSSHEKEIAELQKRFIDEKRSQATKGPSKT